MCCGLFTLIWRRFGIVVDCSRYNIKELSMDEIVINVEFEKENATESLSNEVQLVSSEISWEDFELMVGRFADV